MYEYRVGGSLAADDPTYIKRHADNELYQALVRGEFCYVLSSRQMGKSSLRVQTRHRLEASGQGHCVAIDMTRIGSRQLSPEQWYQGIAFELQRKLGSQSLVNLPLWWQGLGELSPVQKLSQFIESILLQDSSQQRLFIFLDEIDSVRSLSFSVADFFGLVRFCHNARADQGHYRRLTWALFGMATPRQLVAAAGQTPFNIGHRISLKGFTLAEAAPLQAGLATRAAYPQAVLAQVLHWTGGQPFLTQKLCWLLYENCRQRPMVAGTEAIMVAQVVRSQIIHNWDSQDEPEHLRTICDRILADDQGTGRRLGLYQQLLSQGSLKADGSDDQAQLRLSGIAIDQNGSLQITNPIYAAVFNGNWVSQRLAELRPYAAALNAWVASHYQDESRLLLGQALQEALAWAAPKHLSELDYRYLSASQEWDSKMVRLELAAQQKATQTLAMAQQKATQIIWLGYLSLGSCLVISVIALLISLLR